MSSLSTCTPSGALCALVGVSQVLRALANAVLGCPGNQAALVATGALPLLVRLAACGSELPAIARQVGRP